MKKSFRWNGRPGQRVFFFLCAPTIESDPPLLKNLEAFENNGFEVTLVDASAIFFPEWRGEREARLPKPRILSIAKTTEILQLIAKLSDSDTVVVTGFSGSIQSVNHFRILRALNKSYATVGFIAVGTLPKYSRQKLLRYELSEIFSGRWAGLVSMVGDVLLYAGSRALKKVRVIFWNLSQRAFLSSRIDFVWAGVEVPQSLAKLTSEKTVIRYIHNLDFDHVLEGSPLSRSSIPADTVLWLDSMGPFDPDMNFPAYRYQHPDRWIDEHRWAIEMIEDYFSTEVVVAAHPKSNPVSERTLYGNRRILHNKLYPAILNSQLVISTGSTAIALVAYARKPILLFDSRFELPLARAIMDSQSRALGVRKFSRYNPVQSQEIEVCETKYDKYVRDFLKKPGTGNEKFWNAVCADLG